MRHRGASPFCFRTSQWIQWSKIRNFNTNCGVPPTFSFSKGQFSLWDALSYVVLFFILNCKDCCFFLWTMIPCKLVLRIEGQNWPLNCSRSSTTLTKTCSLQHNTFTFFNFIAFIAGQDNAAWSTVSWVWCTHRACTPKKIQLTSGTLHRLRHSASEYRDLLARVH